MHPFVADGARHNLHRFRVLAIAAHQHIPVVKTAFRACHQQCMPLVQGCLRERGLAITASSQQQCRHAFGAGIAHPFHFRVQAQLVAERGTHIGLRQALARERVELGGQIRILNMDTATRALLRRRGTPYDELGLDDPKWTDDQLIEQMLARPILIERPIVVTARGARLCRPPEKVLEILPEA